MDIAFLIVLFILNFFTAIFRITSTAHSLIDVIAGIILGLIISLVFVYYDVSVKRER
jgi:membrane-associated phospholipid phosphatase